MAGAPEKIFVQDLCPGMSVKSLFALSHRALRSFRDPSRGKFLVLELADRTGSVRGMVWENPQAAWDILTGHEIVLVEGRVESYQGAAQISVERVVPWEGVSDMSDFLPASARDLPEMEKELWRAVESVGDAGLKALLSDWLGEAEFYRRYITAPAAKQVHHNFVHGLLEHSLEVAGILHSLSDRHPELDRDLLISGALLHDVGKTLEFSLGSHIDYSDEGRLLGHVAMGYHMVSWRLERYPDFPPSRGMHLVHLVLTHHGEREFGAPVLPQTPEAAALHHADLLSSKVNQFQTSLRRRGDEAWTEYDSLLGRFLWGGGGRRQDGIQ